MLPVIFQTTLMLCVSQTFYCGSCKWWGNCPSWTGCGYSASIELRESTTTMIVATTMITPVVPIGSLAQGIVGDEEPNIIDMLWSRNEIGWLSYLISFILQPTPIPWAVKFQYTSHQLGRISSTTNRFGWYIRNDLYLKSMLFPARLGVRLFFDPHHLLPL